MRQFSELSGAGQLRRLTNLARLALRDYGLEGAPLRRPLHGFNTSFRVDAPDGARYLLRIHRPDRNSPAEIRSELAWLAALQREMKGRVPAPVPTLAGEPMAVVEGAGVPGPRVCVLLSWLPGRFLDDGLTPRHLEQVGELMARLHLHAAAFERPPGFTRRRVDTITSLAHHLPDHFSDAVITHAAELIDMSHGARGASVVVEAFERAREAREQLGDSPGRWGLIHAHLHQENYLFHRGAVAAIDFDDCGFGHYVYDVAVTMSELSHRPDEPELRAGLLRGYRSVRPFSPEEEALIDTFIALRDLQLMFWFIEERHTPAFRDSWRDDVTRILGAVERRLAS